VLGGIGIQAEHAQFVTDASCTKLIPLCQQALENIKHNGQAVTTMDPITLKPNDRVIFGTSSVFLFRNRDAETADQEIRDTPENPVTFEFAMREFKKIADAAQEQQREVERLEAEARAAEQMATLRAQMDKEKEAADAQRLAMQKEMEEQMAKLQQEIANKQDDEAAKAAALEREAQMRIEME
jgi:serine phosphatase RsbU (regulator of sigma subunit)